MASLADGPERYETQAPLASHERRQNTDFHLTAVEQAVKHTEHSAAATPQHVVLRNFITFQYRNYELLEPYLHAPKTLHSQLLFPLPPETRQYLITTFYSLDERVVREILGKKLSSRSRKELDDVCEKTSVPVGGCRRMFDNLKRLARKVEDVEGNIVRVISQEFSVPRDLASQYATIIFINTHRLDTSKRKLSHLTFADIIYVASVFIQYLTNSAASSFDEIDPSLAQDARDLKTLIYNQRDVLEEFKTIVTDHLANLGHAHIMDKGGQTPFKILIRNILAIGAGLNHGKEFRDIFLSLQEKVVEPCVGMGWSPADAELFFTAVVTQFEAVPALQPTVKKRYSGSFTSLFTAVKFAAMRLHTAAAAESARQKAPTGS
ncbi:hypothetical protein HK104_002066 [Borealophlyctis nickersoniae]|nr:hypothetical protein HK104_002066 [Borealophlyctis nickersoniae]